MELNKYEVLHWDGNNEPSELREYMVTGQKKVVRELGGITSWTKSKMHDNFLQERQVSA